MTKSAGPLNGIRVLELGSMIAGPVAATLLGDLGAEVIKIEDPNGGDPIRQSGAMVDGESLYWNVEGRNKQSVTINLRRPEGQELLRKLVESADLLIENFRPGTMDGWGLGYERLSAINPRLVMLSVSGYGQTGPNAPLPAYDRIGLAFAGLLNMTGFPDQPPVRPGTAIADYQAAVFGAFSAMVALYDRDARGGEGQHIDLALFEAVFRFTDIMVAAYDKLGLPRERQGNKHYAAAPGDHFLMADGRYLALTVSANSVFKRLCAAMGKPELSDDPRFLDHQLRVANYDIINGIVAAWIRENEVDVVLAALREHGVPNSIIYSVQDIVADPHYAARGLIATVEHPKLGAIKMQGPLPKMSKTPAPPLRPAPDLGEHTDSVLQSLASLEQDKIAELRRSSII